MSTIEYIQQIEIENEELRKKLFRYDTIRDIISARINISDTNVFSHLEPLTLCQYMEKFGWSMKYEKPHERFLTRSYLSPHKDTKCKIFVKDLTPTKTGPTGSVIALKLRDAVTLLARIHKKGELEVIYEAITGDIREEQHATPHTT